MAHPSCNLVVHVGGTKEHIEAHELDALLGGKLSATFPGATFTALFDDRQLAALARLSARAAARRPGFERRDFAAYRQLWLPGTPEPARVFEALARLPRVDEAYLLAIGADASIDTVAGTDRGVLFQRYLQSAPTGIDARFAWSRGGDGRGQTLVDVERGWELDHLDLSEHRIHLQHGDNAAAYRGHGTAVLGVACASERGPDASVRPSAGCTGVAPRVDAIDVFAVRPDGGDLTEVLCYALDRPAGDVVLLEVQSLMPVPHDTLLGPVETFSHIFDMIATAVAAGVVVIEVGGNGTGSDHPSGGKAPALDMDAFSLPRLDGGQIRPFDRRHRDSGAIIVSASTCEAPYRRLPYAPHGDRIDFFAWGENVFAPHSEHGTTSTYRNDFGGTSAAAAIIAGAALSLQSIYYRAHGKRLDGLGIREVLAIGATRPADGEAAMGVMPNLRSAIERILP
jgi:Subtilase family